MSMKLQQAAPTWGQRSIHRGGVLVLVTVLVGLGLGGIGAGILGVATANGGRAAG